MSLNFGSVGLPNGNLPCAREGMLVLGGIGYMHGNCIECGCREVRVNAIGIGSEEIMRDLAARQFGLVL